jgi:hypothetical protein
MLRVHNNNHEHGTQKQSLKAILRMAQTFILDKSDPWFKSRGRQATEVTNQPLRLPAATVAAASLHFPLE